MAEPILTEGDVAAVELLKHLLSQAADVTEIAAQLFELDAEHEGPFLHQAASIAGEATSDEDPAWARDAWLTMLRPHLSTASSVAVTRNEQQTRWYQATTLHGAPYVG